MTLPSSPESPQPLHVVSDAVQSWVGRLSGIWTEGQVTQLNRRGGGLSYLRVRDLTEDVSVSACASPSVIDGVEPPIGAGSRIVMFARPEWWARRGEIQFRASDIRAVGLGDLLARIERLRKQLEGEGLFRPDLKRPLPFIPRTVGLVCGRASAAERDVIDNARRRWPAVRFDIREVLVQGPRAALDVAAAIGELEGIPDLDVIIITRGGGSVEDLLPFSDEALVRAVARCRVPTVSAVGHEQDSPLIDLAADVRASTPTDAARKVVPDLQEQLGVVRDAQRRIRRAIQNHVAGEVRALAQLLRHPALSDPESVLTDLERSVIELSRRSSRELASLLSGTSERLYHDRARLRAVSPLATLERGYAVVTAAPPGPVQSGVIVRDASAIEAGQGLLIQVARGRLTATVSTTEPEEIE